MQGKFAVVKYGGHAMDVPELSFAFRTDLAKLVEQGLSCVVVHGGGPQINALLKELNLKSQFVRGLRVTDSATMNAVEMVLAGQVNKKIVAELNFAKLRAVGLSGRDANLLTAKVKDEELGLVGEVTAVQADLLKLLLSAHYLPVVAPVAAGPKGEALNINADTAAGAIAGSLKADYFVLISDVAGVLDGEGRLLSRLNQAEIAELIRAGVISGGMLPKVEACLNALALGAGSALILDGRAKSSLYRHLAQGEALGTVIVP